MAARLLVAAVVLAAGSQTTAWTPSPAAGAQAHRNPKPPDSARHIQSMEPRSGPPGTEISIYTENLPLQGRVVLGMGAVGAGFEALGEAQQQEWGEIGGTLAVPEYATWDRALVVIIFNGNFVPTGLSDPFHVTNAEGLVRRSGVLTDVGEGCRTMRDWDGYFYSLAGPEDGVRLPNDEPRPDLAVLREARAGDSIVVEGRFEAEGLCPQGETIEVTRVVWKEGGSGGR